ncbi:MAG: ABC transporter substrate-binding protein [Alphaproteobacteria bacterium]
MRNLLVPVLFAAVLGASQTASATTDDAARLVHQLGNQTIATLQTPGLTVEQRETRFRGLLTQGFDLTFIGRFALGKYWRVATPEQQSAYLNLFGEYLVQTYATRLGGYGGGTMTVIGARQASDKDVVVRTQIGATGGRTLIADWRVRAGAQGYRIIDVMIEGISLAITHRVEFAAVVERHGIDGLLAILRDHTARTQTTAALF